MRFFKHLLLIVVLFASVQANAQYEILFTQYQMSPLTLNPALTGAYEGSYRVGGISRRQWDVPTSTFFTNSVFVDAPLIMVGKRNWIGAGLMMYRDAAGSAENRLNQSNVALSAAFHYALDKKYKNIFTFGLKIGGSSFAFNPTTNDPLTYTGLAGKSDPDFKNNYPTRKFVDFSAGVMLKSKIDKKSNITVGVGLGHINSPRIGLNKATATTTGYKLPMAFTGHIEYSRDINKKLSIMPSFLFRTISGSKDGTIQAQVGYKLDPVRKPDLVLKAGLGYRLIQNYNNLCILIGADYKNFRFGLGYDIPRADLATAVNNTLELSLHYTGKIYKKPVTKGAHFCPKY